MKEKFKKGEMVLMKNANMNTWAERIFLCEYMGKYYGKCQNDIIVFAYSEVKKIEPVYRLLNVGEEIIEGDEIYNEYKRCWEYAYDKDIIKNVHYSWTPFRRKIKTYEE